MLFLSIYTYLLAAPRAEYIPTWYYVIEFTSLLASTELQRNDINFRFFPPSKLKSHRRILTVFR